MNTAAGRMGSGMLVMPVVFALGFAASSLTSGMGSAATHGAWWSMSVADLARPEVFVPVFLVVVVLLGMLALRENGGSAPAAGRSAPRASASAVLQEASAGAAMTGERQALAKTRDGIEEQLNSIVSTVSDYMAGSGRYSRSLSEAQTELGVADTLERVREIVETLVEENARAVEETRSLRGNLETATRRMTSLKESLDEAKMQASTDALTGAANRRSFDGFIAETVRRSHVEQMPMCLILADIDHFKRINDTYGHQAGDEVLRDFASVLRGSVRATDMVARYGGEEFAIVLPRATAGSALAVAERTMKQLAAKQFRAGGQVIGRVTASFGIAAIQSSETAEDLIARADKKVYEAKIKGRNRAEIDTLSSA